MISPKTRKLLTLALDPAAMDGEWRNAAVMLIAAMRKTGTQAQELLAPPSIRSAPQWTPPPYASPFEVRMPFGVHKGKRISQIPADYLQWLLTLKNLKPDLRRAVEAELSKP